MIPRPTALDPTLPISIEDANAALRIRNDFENSVLDRKLWAALEYIEWRTSRYLRRAAVESVFLDWPCNVENEHYIAAAPVRAVTAVEYRDEAGAWVEAVDGSWDWARTPGGARVYFFSTFSPPALSTEHPDRVRIIVEAGYYARTDSDTGADPEVVMPARIEEAILSLAGHWFANREASTVGEKAQLPLSLKMLVDSLRIYR
jgi:uncharacterized phiE125 gp8 family phage protein